MLGGLGRGAGDLLNILAAAWRRHHFPSRLACAEALGLDRETVAALETGRTRHQGRRYPVPTYIALACAAYSLDIRFEHFPTATPGPGVKAACWRCGRSVRVRNDGLLPRHRSALSIERHASLLRGACVASDTPPHWEKVNRE